MIISGHFLETAIQCKVELIVKEYKNFYKEEMEDSELSTNYTLKKPNLLKRSNGKCKKVCNNNEYCED